MGHDSERAAMIYLHSSAERQRALADAGGQDGTAELVKSKPLVSRAIWHADGTEAPFRPLTWRLTSAPTATRTRDLPLRRRSLYPLSYRGLRQAKLTLGWCAPAAVCPTSSPARRYRDLVLPCSRVAEH